MASRMTLTSLLLAAVLLSLAGSTARALTYTATPDLARGQYLSLRAALQAQPATAPELLAAGDMSLRGKVWELAGRLRSALQCTKTGIFRQVPASSHKKRAKRIRIGPPIQADIR